MPLALVAWKCCCSVTTRAATASALRACCALRLTCLRDTRCLLVAVFCSANTPEQTMQYRRPASKRRSSGCSLMRLRTFPLFTVVRCLPRLAPTGGLLLRLRGATAEESDEEPLSSPVKTSNTSGVSASADLEPVGAAGSGGAALLLQRIRMALLILIRSCFKGCCFRYMWWRQSGHTEYHTYFGLFVASLRPRARTDFSGDSKRCSIVSPLLTPLDGAAPLLSIGRGLVRRILDQPC